MNTTSMPGFTAENSIYWSRGVIARLQFFRQPILLQSSNLLCLKFAMR